MASVINESDMVFIADNAFHIEKSPEYTNLGNGVKSVEFVRVMNNNLLFIEARKTFPNPYSSKENRERFKSQLSDICDKFVHSLNLFAAIKVGVTGYPTQRDFSLPERVSLFFVLVIKNHEPSWCKKIEPTLRAALPRHLMKIWRPKIYVVNQATAGKRGLTCG